MKSCLSTNDGTSVLNSGTYEVLKQVPLIYMLSNLNRGLHLYPHNGKCLLSHQIICHQELLLPPINAFFSIWELRFSRKSLGIKMIDSPTSERGLQRTRYMRLTACFISSAPSLMSPTGFQGFSKCNTEPCTRITSNAF